MADSSSTNPLASASPTSTNYSILATTVGSDSSTFAESSSVSHPQFHLKDHSHSAAGGGSSPADSPSHTWAYILAILATLIALGVLTAMVVFFLKRAKLNKLRHHLMPLYNFDPTEEGLDWEAELLEDGLYHHIPPYSNMTTRDVNHQQTAAAAVPSDTVNLNPKLSFAGTDYNSTSNT